jgi:alkaline phosphatase
LTRSGHRAAIVALGCLAVTGAAIAADPAPEARNVVLMIADGAGFNAWKATAMYEGTVGSDFHDAAGWVELALSAHSLRRNPEPPVSTEHGLTQFPSLVYDPARAWDPTPVPGGHGAYPYYFAGYEWLRQTAPDSAATITSLVTGLKTYDGSVNFDGSGRPAGDTVAGLAHARGKLVGVVSSVQFAHATPAAAAGAHHADRSAYCEIALEMLTGPYPDFIAGCGNPDFDNNGEPLADAGAKDYRYVGGKEIWALLTGTGRPEVGQEVCVRPVVGGEQGVALTAERIGALERWTLRQSRPEIDSLREGPTPDRLLVVPQVGQAVLWGGRAPASPEHAHGVRVGGTLHQARGSRAAPRYTPPGHDPLLTGVPSLETLTRVALNALDDGEGGFFLHVEGGAVDWAMHDNQMGRMIEEMSDFKRSVEVVIEWVEDHGGWDETLLIVTADHDHLLWGPRADTLPFDPLQDRGEGRLPSYRWLSNSHSNALLPLYARGVGSDRFASLAASEDPFYGPYADHTDVFEVMRAALGP